MFFIEAATSSTTPARAAARKHSSVSASMPLIMTLRTILMAAAAPISLPATVTRMPSAVISGAIAAACGPASSVGVWWRAGWIGTSRPRRRRGRRRRDLLRCPACGRGETESMSRKNGCCARCCFTDCAASTLDAAVTAEMTASAPCTASAAEPSQRTPIAAAACLSFSPSGVGKSMSHAAIVSMPARAGLMRWPGRLAEADEREWVCPLPWRPLPISQCAFCDACGRQ